MNKRRYWSSLACAWLLTLAAATAAHAQAGNYPNRPVTIICDAAAGATPDVDARFVAEGLGKIWGQQVVVINRPGANGSIAARSASEAAPDGYTLFMPALSTFVALLTVAPNLPLKLPRDFLPIGFTAENPMFVAVNASLGVSTLPQLIALAKKEPGKVSIAVTGVGRLTHLTGELLQERAGIKLLSIPYVGGPAPALGDVATGRVSMIIEGYSGIAGAVNAGSVKLIAVASPAAPAAVPRPADRGGDDPRLCRHRLAGPGGAGRHPRADRPQGQRRSAHGGHRCGPRDEPGQDRQLFARDVGRRSARLRAKGAANLAAGAGEDRRRDQVAGGLQH